MLYRVSYARKVFEIAETADVDVHGSGGLVGLGIVDKQGFELVGQLDDSVGAIIEEWLLEALCQAFNASGSAVRSGFSHGCECATRKGDGATG